MLVRQLFDEKLAQYAYLVGCPATGDAMVIDPERDIDRYYQLAERKGLDIVAVVDTHIHADYLTGLREFAERGVKVYASDEGDADWKYEWLLESEYDYQLLKDGDSFNVGNLVVQAMHTPGHTPEHLSFLITDTGSGSEVPIALATGDFVFVGDLGRPDLLETAAGQKGAMEPAARVLFESVEKFKDLPEFLQVWPCHGAGSACGKALGDVPLSTVGYELRNNASIQASSSEKEFVDFILEGQPEPPMYFARMKRDNRSGPAILGDLPQPQEIDAKTLGGLAGRTDVAVLDTRERDKYLESHLPGSILAELDYQFPNIAGSYVEEDTPIYLIVEPKRVEEAVRDLIRIGLDRIEGWASPGTLAKHASSGGEVKTMREIDMEELERRRTRGDVHVLDVRGAAEHATKHVPGSQNIAHTRLYLRKDEVPKDRPVLVHCNSGGRSAAAASLLERYGFDVVQVNDLIANYEPREKATA